MKKKHQAPSTKHQRSTKFQAPRQLSVLFALCVSLLAFPGCVTTKDAAGNSTTTLTPAGEAAVQVATQIASTAASAAIQTFLTNAPAVHGRLKASAAELAPAKAATEEKIRNAEPSLSRAQVHRIVERAFIKELHR